MINPANTPAERELLRLFRELNEQDRASVQAFTAFLQQRAANARQLIEEEALLEPKEIPRPDGESVMGAIKRLSESFYMLDRSSMIHETSSLMSDHLLQGRDAMEVIDELEEMFNRHFTDYQGSEDGENTP